MTGLPKVLRLSQPVAPAQGGPAQDGQVIDMAFQDRLAKKRSQSELARALTLQNWLAGLAALSLLAAIVAGIGWHRAADRYANNVRIAWVKLFADGTHEFQFFEDGGAGNRWYDASINASLMNYVEHRFQKKKATISYDYGFALQFLAPQLRRQFIKEDDAPAVAVALEECPLCEEVDVHVRAIDHDQISSPNSEADTDRIFKSTVYVTETSRSDQGHEIGRVNKLVHLTWRLAPVETVTQNQEMLKANPLGIEIISQVIREDLSNG